ncbi:hypothetical protein [Agrobacterium tumefaciens]|nr:hypothetical protein [Agrobacterium tumefaciens]
MACPAEIVAQRVDRAEGANVIGSKDGISTVSARTVVRSPSLS